jgi:uncharacterized protein (TIGR00369 family)
MTMTTNSYFARLQRGEVPPPAVATMLGGRIRHVDMDAGTLESDYSGVPAFFNPAGQIQGGMLGAMLDDVTAFLVTACLGEDEYCSTLNLNLSFLRPAGAGPLLGRARMVRRGGTICNVTGELVQGGKVVATAVATCLIMKRA